MFEQTRPSLWSPSLLPRPSFWRRSPRNVSIEATEISSNADGPNEVTHINYDLARNAGVPNGFALPPDGLYTVEDVVSGGIRVTDLFGVHNPQPGWVRLIHEGVAVGQTEFRVDPVAIQIDVPDEAHMLGFAPREIPDPALSADSTP